MENPSMSQIKKLKKCVGDMLTINNEISLSAITRKMAGDRVG